MMSCFTAINVLVTCGCTTLKKTNADTQTYKYTQPNNFMETDDILNKVIRAQVLAQLLLEQLDELEMTDKVWKMQAKKFGAQAIRTGESMVNMLTGSLGCLESQSYVNSCDYVRQRVDEINLEISPTD